MLKLTKPKNIEESLIMKEPKAPDDLKKLQTAYSKSIMTPFKFLDEGAVCDTNAYDAYILNQIHPKDKLTEKDRLQTYNEQYWYRLFTVMQDEYPLTCALLGYRDFNILVSKYLTEKSSHHFSLSHLSDDLLIFLKNSDEYRLELIRQSIFLERIYIELFDQSDVSAFDPNQIQNLDFNIEQFSLREDLHLVAEHWNLVYCRNLIKSKEWQAETEPPLNSEINHWCIYRKGLSIVEETIGPAQFVLLKALKHGNSFEEAFSHLAEHFSDQELVGIEDAVPNWFGRWSQLGWFTIKK